MGIIGIVSPVGDELKTRVRALATESDFLAEADSYTVVAQCSGTSIAFRAPAPSTAFVVMEGSPLDVRLGAYAPLAQASIPSLVDGSIADVQRRIHGQYAAVRLRGGKLELFADPACLRSMYVYRANDAVLFSSRFSAISRLVPGLEIDFEDFGSHWLAHNQLHDGFFVRGVERLTGGRSMELATDDPNVRVEMKERGPFPGSMEDDLDKPGGPSDPLASVRGLLQRSDRPFRLSLSGGMDSRLLAALASCAGDGRVEAFVYETPGSDEADVAVRVARALSLPCRRIAPRSFDDLSASDSLESYARDSYCLSPLSSALQLSHYEQIFSACPDAVLMDGAFGEVGRARFYRRIAMLRKQAALRGALTLKRVDWGRPDAYAGALSFARADIFDGEVDDALQRGLLRDVEAFVRFLDGLEGARPEDRAGVRFRRTNFFGYAQEWIDGFGFNVMPFGQPLFVEPMLRIPVSHRRAGAWYKREIRRSASAAARLPLCKGTSVVPFWLPGPLAPLFSRISGTGRAKPFRWTGQREFVMDRVRDGSTRSYAPYDLSKIDRLARAVLGGRHELNAALDWFLAFDEWRRSNRLD